MLLDERAEGTGLWFLDGDIFTAFRGGKIKSVLLNGKGEVWFCVSRISSDRMSAGCGKSTMLCVPVHGAYDFQIDMFHFSAAASQALQAYGVSTLPGSLVLVHLFDTTHGSGTQDLHAALSALLYQMASKSTECAHAILESRKKAIESGFTTKTDKERLLMNLLRAASSQIFIVIDALDEADEADILPFLMRLRELSTVSLLASRRTAINVAALFDIVVSVEDSDTDSDIRTVLDLSMSSGGALESIRDRDGVRQALLARAEGKSVTQYCSIPHLDIFSSVYVGRH